MSLNHILICGLGSIGRRHLRHFRALGVERIDAFRTGRATLSDENQPQPDQVFGSLEDGLMAGPQAVVVANPTSLHLKTALAAVRVGAHVLVEKPVSHTIVGLETLAQEAAQRNVQVYVGYNLRFHPALQAVREVIQSRKPLGSVLNARIHFGAYLPDWHPWEDFRASYAAVKEMGGGVTLTSSHELDYALWLMGPVERAIGMASDLHPLGTNVDEISAITIRHRSGTLTTITLSFAQKPVSRSVKLSFEHGNLSLDLIKGSWTVHLNDGTTSEYSVPENYQIDETYRKQAEAFLSALGGHPGDLATLTEAKESLNLAEIILEIL